ncbi:glycoside hydrolase family 18 protein [Amniculicola lignicola CBS 123094]|uniref:chitinase n=1 Tax=Amniculicola lignicola CBS 123094 TaxID=1392246 RepID=A0A6A5VXE1_9PLEO|nr:glycoside hydrolase family 18 protein [Amniculicola lignicola CBS 123094]
MWHPSGYAILSLLTLCSLSSAQQGPGRACPVACSVAGRDPTTWTDLHGVNALKRCTEPVLFDTSIYTDVNDPSSPLKLRTCTASNKIPKEEVEYSPAPFTFGTPLQRRGNSTNSTVLHGCLPDAHTFTNKTAVNLLRWNADQESAKGAGVNAVLSAAEALKVYLSGQDDCSLTIMMARHGDATVGLYVGTEVLTSSATTVVEQFISALQKGGDVSRFAAQSCSSDKTPSTWTIGMYADFRGNISATQEALRTWAGGKCFLDSDSKDIGDKIDISFVLATGAPNRSNSPEVSKRELVARAECTAIQVGDGDGCWSLAQRCGTTQTVFEGYNKATNFCTSLKPKQWVCCSKGDLPNMGPKPGADGSCASYTIQPNDICFNIAETYQITVPKIESYNNQTWGWGGCSAIQPGQFICLSKGTPPMPAPLTNALCGPQVVGTKRPTDGTDIKDLNPCPLNVCCNVWGQCGITSDFCVLNPASTKAPGTTMPGKNSCVSSCGMNITNNASPPAQFRMIAYFESWNLDRPCLHMDITNVLEQTQITHIHFAFPSITKDFKVNITGQEDQFEKFKSMTGVKRIVSFGGWAFSTEAPTYNIFREGVTAANRATLATNIAQFILDNKMDGVDFDWEYPAAPDIPGIPAGSIEAGKQYLEFLKLVKRRLASKEVAIAAPASYWYLKGFPIKEVSQIVDYIVYMTYDLHGQWDYGNKWSSPGCDSGDCLRSHINITETTDALAMVTKAGVPANKIVVGVASYGRSFHMAQVGCDGPNCKFTGSALESNAMPGRCTNTAGYIANAEIREILADSAGGLGYSVKSWHDGPSNSDMLVYNNEEWVAYMSDTTKGTRTTWVRGLNFGGTSDWAIDLNRDYGDDGVGNMDPEDVEMGGGPVCNQADVYDSLEEISAASSLDPTCAQLYSLRVLSKMLYGAMDKYKQVDDGYDSKFKSYIKYLKKGLPEGLRLWVHWLNGEGQAFFDCRFRGNGDDWTGPCPVPRSVRGGLLIGIWTIDMTLRDHDGFFKALYKKTGIMEDWIKFGKYEEETQCNPACMNKLELTVNGLPQLKDEYTIPNPKDIIQKAMGNSQNLLNQLTARTFDVGMGLWSGGNPDVVQALAIPVFLVENAIEGMEDAKELGEKEEKEAAKNKLLLILSLVFLIVPFLGEAAAIAAGSVAMARVIALIGAGANVGLTLQEVIENPDMAPFAIMELLTAGRLKTPKDYSDALKFRNFMKTSDIETLGEKFVKQDAMIQKIVNACKR